MTSRHSPQNSALPPFVGRDAQLEALAAGMRGESSGRFALVVGPAGIGKSRLVGEFAHVAETAGRRVIWAQCWDAEAGPAFWPWTQVVRELLDTPDATELATLLLDDAVEATPVALFDATARAIRSAALEHPILVIVEDLHQADPASIALASFLAAHLRDASVTVVGTTRPVDAVLHALADLAPPLTLEPLDLASVAALVPAGVDTAAVYSASGGNPLLISAIVRSGISPAHVNAGMARVISDRVAALNTDANRVLVALSVHGLEASIDRLADLARLDSVRAEAAARATVEAGLLEPCAGGEGVRFSHQIIAEVVTRDASPTLVAEVHARAAELLGDSDTHLAERAHHLAHAGPKHAPDAVTASVLAARASLAGLAPDDAVRLCTQALALLRAEDGSDDRMRARTLTLLARAQWLAGEHALALATSDAAWEVAITTSDPELVAEAALGPRFGFGFEDPGAVERARRLTLALSRLSDQSTALHVRVLAALALSQLVHDPIAAVENAASAVDSATLLDDQLALGFALVARSAADLSPDTVQSRLRDARRILDIARRSGEHLLAPSGYLLLLGALLELGDIRALDGELTDLGDAGDGFENLLSGRHAQWFRTVRATLDGDTARAESLINDAFALAQRDGDSDAESVWAGQLSIVRWMQDRLDETEPVLAVAVQRFPGELVWAASLAWVRLRLGRREAAGGFLATLGELGDIPRDRNWLATVAIIADIVADVGSDDEVQDAYLALEPYARQLVPIGLGVTCWGTAARPLGRLAIRMGDTARASEHFRTAIAVCARTGAQAWLAEAQLDLAQLLATGDSPRDDDETNQAESNEASALVSQALAAATQRDWPGLRARAEAALAELPDSTGSIDPAPTAEKQLAKPLVRVLGRFEVVSTDGAVATWSSRKARELLKVLVAARGHAISRDTIEAHLWPGVPSRLLANRLSVTLATVRRALDPGREHPVQHFVRFDGEAFALESSRVDVDAEEFLVEAQRALESVNVVELDRAIDAYRGDAFADEPYAEWADALRSLAQSAFCDCVALRADEAIEEGRPGRAAELFRDILAIDEFDLAAHRGLNRALGALGAQHQSRSAQLSYNHVVRELSDDGEQIAQSGSA